MTKETMKRDLRATRTFRPEDEPLLDIAINQAVQFVWDAHEWSFKKGVSTFTTSSGTYQLPTEVDNLLELTYGTNNRVVQPLPSYRVAEKYSNVSRTGTDSVYFFSLYSADSDAMTIELTPTPGSGVTFTYKYNKKIDYGDLSAIPDKLHPHVFTAARMYLGSGMIQMWSALADAIQRDKPIRHFRWSMGRDSVHTSRVDEANSIMSGGSNQDTTKPID